MVDLKKLIDSMTIDEKIGQLAQYDANLIVQSDAEITGLYQHYGLNEEATKKIGSILNFSNVEEMRKAQDRHLAEDRHKIPLIFMMDVIHGYRTIYPIPLALACSFDENLVADCSKIAAKEASANGIHATFTPMVDLVRDARWGRVMESGGEDTLLGCVMGVAQVKAFQGDDLKNQDNIAACVKHFAAYGAVESGRDYNSVYISEGMLRENYFPAFKACIDAGVKMVMPSYNVLNGVPAIANKWLMKTILKDEWDYKGIVISDYNATGELITHGIAANDNEAAKLSFANGCDIDMCSSRYQKELKKLIENGEFSEKQLDEAVMRVLSLKEELGLFEDPYRGASAQKAEKAVLTPESRATVRRAAADSAVLLKNEGILPLADTIGKIALIGPFADEGKILGGWNCRGTEEDTVTVYNGIKNAFPNAEVVVAGGCSAEWNNLDRDGFEQAIDAAKWADAVVLCLGEPQDYSGESNSRTDIDLPGLQNELAEEILKVNKNTVAVLFAGRPLVLTRLNKIAPAMLYMWFPGTEGGNSVADLLTGKVNPNGKLSMSFPKSVGQCPIYYNRTITGRPKDPKDEDVRRYYSSGYIDCGNLSLFPFGYGLSYSNFVYEDVTLSKTEMTAEDTVSVSVTVYNDSDIAGRETVQLYMRDMVASTARPVQQLIAFEKAEFAARERKTLVFTIKEPMLRFVNNENEFVSEAGEFQISVGCADNLMHTKSLFLK